MTESNRTDTPDLVTRVLVLDDHDISRRYSVAALRQAGLTVKASGNPAAALETAAGWLPQAIFVDIDLPGMDGYAWITRLRGKWPRQQPLPRFIVLSAEPPGKTADGRAATSSFVHLRKPATPNELRRAIEPADLEASDDQPPNAAPSVLPGVANLLRIELRRALRELDEHLARRDLEAATRLLHQLLAASRMCRERRLEKSLSLLLGACRAHAATAAGSAEIARSYFALLGAAAPLMDAPSAASR